VGKKNEKVKKWKKSNQKTFLDGKSPFQCSKKKKKKGVQKKKKKTNTKNKNKKKKKKKKAV